MDQVRVLVVDDQAVFRRVMSAVVEQTEGFSWWAWPLGRGVDRKGGSPAPGSGADGRQPPRHRRDGGGPQATGETTPPPWSCCPRDEGDWGGQPEECGAVAYVAKAAFGPDALGAVWAMAGG